MINDLILETLRNIMQTIAHSAMGVYIENQIQDISIQFFLLMFALTALFLGLTILKNAICNFALKLLRS